MGFPDDLSVASYAAKEGMPILITQSTKLSKATETANKDIGVKETIIGGFISRFPPCIRLESKDLC